LKISRKMRLAGVDINGPLCCRSEEFRMGNVKSDRVFGQMALERVHSEAYCKMLLNVIGLVYVCNSQLVTPGVNFGSRFSAPARASSHVAPSFMNRRLIVSLTLMETPGNERKVTTSLQPNANHMIQAQRLPRNAIIPQMFASRKSCPRSKKFVESVMSCPRHGICIVQLRAHVPSYPNLLFDCAQHFNEFSATSLVMIQLLLMYYGNNY
jgi:hypothetical protein